MFIRYFEMKEQLNLKPVIPVIRYETLSPLLEDKDYTEAWRKGEEVICIARDEDRKLNVIIAPRNMHEYYFTDDDMEKFFKESTREIPKGYQK